LLQLRPREREAFNYSAKLKEKFQHHPQVRRIARHRHVPKAIHAAAAEHRIIRAAQKQKYAASSGEYFLNNITAALILWEWEFLGSHTSCKRV